MTEKFEKITHFSPAFDHCDSPDPKKFQYGRGGVRCRMILKGEKGAIQFLFSPGMYLEKTYQLCPSISQSSFSGVPYSGRDVGYHSPKPMYEEDSPMNGECEYVEGGKCYYDGSTMRAEEWIKILVEEGSDKIWLMMEEEYNERFNQDTNQ